MPLARYALYAEGVQVYVASTWDSGDAWLATMRHIASEGRCWVIGSGCALRVSDVPRSFPSADTVFPESDNWRTRETRSSSHPPARSSPAHCTRPTNILYADIDATESAKPGPHAGCRRPLRPVRTAARRVEAPRRSGTFPPHHVRALLPTRPACLVGDQGDLAARLAGADRAMRLACGRDRKRWTLHHLEPAPGESRE